MLEHGANVGAEGDNSVILFQIANGDDGTIKLLSERGAEGMLRHDPYRASSLGSPWRAQITRNGSASSHINVRLSLRGFFFYLEMHSYAKLRASKKASRIPRAAQNHRRVDPGV